MATPLVTAKPAIAYTPEMRCYLQRKFGKIGVAKAEIRETDILLIVRPNNMSSQIQQRLYLVVDAIKHEIQPQLVTLRLEVSHLLSKKPHYWSTSFIATA